MTTINAKDKKPAHEANKSAIDADYHAKQARQRASRLNDFQVDVANLKIKIAGYKTKLLSLSLSGNNHNGLTYFQFAHKQTMQHIIPWWGINAPLWQSHSLHSLK